MQEAAGGPKEPKCDANTIYREKNKVKKKEKEANARQPLTPIWYCDARSESERCSLFPMMKKTESRMNLLE